MTVSMATCVDTLGEVADFCRKTIPKENRKYAHFSLKEIPLANRGYCFLSGGGKWMMMGLHFLNFRNFVTCF